METSAVFTVGTGVASCVGAGVSAAVGVRAFLDRYKSKSLTAVRVKYRTERLRALRKLNAVRFELPLGEEEGMA